jgi:phosphoribosylformimino-5-aminoimidazole carboxamide ribotide isomerase
MSLERTSPRLIPVLDVMNGQVVHAVGGQRDEYRPIVSKLTDSTEPVEVAKALLAATGANELYVADLDAIRQRDGISRAVVWLLHEVGVPIWVDSGLSGSESSTDLRISRWTQHVLPLETAGGQGGLQGFVAMAQAMNPMAFSIDLKAGELLGRWWREWGARTRQDAIGVARTAVRYGLRTLIVLDLARVGTGQGSGTESLLGAIRAELPEIELIAGGGVRNWDDIDRLGAAGADAVLVASALHDRTLAIPRPTEG